MNISSVIVRFIVIMPIVFILGQAGNVNVVIAFKRVAGGKSPPGAKETNVVVVGADNVGIAIKGVAGGVIPFGAKETNVVVVVKGVAVVAIIVHWTRVVQNFVVESSIVMG